MRTFSSVLALGLVVSAVACASGGEEAASSDEDSTTGWVTSEVKSRLSTIFPNEENKTWAVTTGNALTGDYLLQMPRMENWGHSSVPAPKKCVDAAHCDADFQLATCASNADCGGGTCAPLAAAGGKSLCIGHSDEVLDAIYGVMTSAQANLDVTSLSPPTGKYLATMRNALAALDKRGAKVSVRFLFGSNPDLAPDPKAVYADLVRGVRAGTTLSIAVGTHRSGPTSWNHSKIIAVDGREAIIGGMNLWDSHYLESDPVHDVSLHIRGPAVVTAQNFVNQLWQVPCGGSTWVGSRSESCPPAFAMAPSSSAPVGTVRMIPIGRLGQLGHNSSDTALVAMMDMAKNNGTIRISQQDIGSFKVLGGGDFPNDYLDAFTRAARRGVDVTVVVSNDGAYGGGGHTASDAYFNGWSLQDLWSGLIARADQQWPDSHPQLCKHVHFARLRASASPTWADGMPYANHAKVVIVDDQAHYVGSQNLYNANLAEFGTIVDDQPATQKFIADYWNNLARYSLPTTYVDPMCSSK